MHCDAIMMTVLTHPLHVFLIGMILGRLVRDGVAAAGQARRADSVSHPEPVADPTDLQAA